MSVTFIKFTFLLLIVALDSFLASPVAKSDDMATDAKRESVIELFGNRRAEHPDLRDGSYPEYPSYYGNGNDLCGLIYYKDLYGVSPCDQPTTSGYLKVIDNPRNYVQCGSGNTAYCRKCGDGTKWSQQFLTCVGSSSG